MMVVTRNQAKLKANKEQPSLLVTSPRANPPRRPYVSQQALQAEVVGTVKDNEGGRLEPTAGKHMVGKISACKNNYCKLCVNFTQSKSFTSTVTQRNYNVDIPRKNKYSCDTDNVVYLITCKGCAAQYVGETCQKLNHRFNDHRNRIKNYNSCSKATVLVDHFTTGACKNSSYYVQIIEKIKNRHAYYPNGKMNRETAIIRREREKFWMKELRTVYPYGLNDRCGKNRDQHNMKDNIYSMLNKNYKRKNKHRGRKIVNRIYFNATHVFETALKTNITVLPHYLNSTIPQMNKSNLQQLGLLATEYIPMEDDYFCDRIINIILDITNNKLEVKDRIKSKKALKQINPIIIKYENAAVGFINLRNILREPDIKDSMVAYTDDEPTVVYKYTQTIRNKILNYSNVMDNVDVENWDEKNMPCECSTKYKAFVDEHHKHVITGNLNIIENKKLRNLFKKGPNFREKNSINFTIARRAINNGLNDYINKWSNKNRRIRNTLLEWKNKVLGRVDDISKNMKKSHLHKWRGVKQTLKDTNCQQELDNLQEKFVITTVDKASNNISFICKPYYISTLLKEVNSNTYEKDKSAEDIITEQIEKCHEFGVTTHQDNRKLPTIYAIPKIHKNPVKFRFIVAAKHCVSKETAKIVTKILKLVMKIHRNYCDAIKNYTGINRMWITESTKDILDDIDHLNHKKGNKTVSTFDFSTLYTNINLEDLKEKLNWIICKAFKGGTNQYIRLSHSVARFDSGKSKGTVYSKDDCINMINYIIDNAYFTVAGQSYKQVIGIPMGTDPAPFIANLYLYYYEFNWLEQLTKTDYGLARKYYGHTRRFIDDLGTLNNQDHIKDNWKSIYPKDLLLNKENVDDTKATFLDLNISVENDTYITKIYDKRDDFTFDIVAYPDIRGNIPESPAYGVIIGQVLRTARNTTRVNDFIQRTNMLFVKLKQKGYVPQKICSSIKKCIVRHPWIIAKYNIDQKNLIFEICNM